MWVCGSMNIMAAPPTPFLFRHSAARRDPARSVSPSLGPRPAGSGVPVEQRRLASGRRAGRSGPATAARRSVSVRPTASHPLEVGAAIGTQGEGANAAPELGRDLRGRPPSARGRSRTMIRGEGRDWRARPGPGSASSRAVDEERLEHHLVPAVLVEAARAGRGCGGPRPRRRRGHVAAQALGRPGPPEAGLARDRAAGRGRGRWPRFTSADCGRDWVKQLGEGRVGASRFAVQGQDARRTRPGSSRVGSQPSPGLPRPPP